MRSDETSIVTVGDRINAIGALSTSSSDPLELFKQAAQTFQTPPAIYQRHRLGLEDLPKVCPFHHQLMKLIPALEPTQLSCIIVSVIGDSKGKSSQDSRALMRGLAQHSESTSQANVCRRRWPTGAQSSQGGAAAQPGTASCHMTTACPMIGPRPRRPRSTKPRARRLGAPTRPSTAACTRPSLPSAGRPSSGELCRSCPTNLNHHTHRPPNMILHSIPHLLAGCSDIVEPHVAHWPTQGCQGSATPGAGDTSMQA